MTSLDLYSRPSINMRRQPIKLTQVVWYGLLMVLLPRVCKIPRKLFWQNQYSWNFIVKTTWISLIGWLLRTSIIDLPSTFMKSELETTRISLIVWPLRRYILDLHISVSSQIANLNKCLKSFYMFSDRQLWGNNDMHSFYTSCFWLCQILKYVHCL